MKTQQELPKSKWLQYLERKFANSSLKPEQKKQAIIAIDIFVNLIVVVALVLFMRTFIISPFQVSGISMCNTLNYFNGQCQNSYGDYIIINKSSYLRLPGWTLGTPQRGDIIVFRPPQHQGEFYIKRVIGLPGETVKLIDGYVYIFNTAHPEGVKLDEPYLNSNNLGSTFATGGIDNFKVPSNQYLVLGDNRTRSTDSRLCFKETPGSPNCGENGITPFITPDLIEGKAALALWPNPRILITPSYSSLN